MGDSSPDLPLFSPRPAPEGEAERPAGKQRRRQFAVGTNLGLEVATDQSGAMSVVALPNEDNRDSAMLDAVAMCERGEYATARHAFRELATEKPGDRTCRAWMHYAWGREHEADGEIDKARAELERSLRLDPGFESAKQALRTLGKKKKGFFRRLFRR